MVNLSGFGLYFGLGLNGSRELVWDLFFIFISNLNFILCIKLFISLCKSCICKYLGFGMKVRPLRSTCFCVSVSVDFLAKITSASKVFCLCWVLGWV